MNTTNLSFAKIVATPTSAAWSQVYNAGSLFIALSLSQTDPTEENGLTTTGKEFLNNLEAEIFTLESKNLSSLRSAVQTCIDEIPPDITLSLTLAYIKEQVLYLILFGSGSIIMKRGTKIGTLLTRKETVSEFVTASGYLQAQDYVILETKQFADCVSEEDLEQSLDLTLPPDIAESLAPKVHNAAEGGASAIIIAITGIPQQTTSSPTEIYEAPELNQGTYHHVPTSVPVESKVKRKRINISTLIPPHVLSKIKFPTFRQMTKKIRLIILSTAALVLIAVLSIFIYQTFNNRNSVKMKQDFEAVYAEASEKYDEAMAIKTLNPVGAQEDLQTAKKLLEDNLAKFPEGTEERQKITALEQKISQEISGTGQAQKLTATSEDSKKSPLLNVLATHSNAVAATEDQQNVYLLTDKVILSIDKTTGKEKDIIKNDSDWQNGIGLGVYFGNLYVLDTKNGVIKFVAAANGFGKTSYFQDTAPDASKLVSLTIDGSIWLLGNDGNILKYTKGKQDTFKINGLAKSMKNPKQIITNADLDNLYVLDAGNSRVIQLTKEGLFKNAYETSSLKNAKAISVSEVDKKIYFLLDSKLYSLSL